MSTRTIQGRPLEVTDRKYYPVTSALWPQVNKMAGRTDLGMKVLEKIPAPALFDPMSADIVLNKALIAHLDPMLVASPDFAKKQPSLFGALVHESSHANQSRMDLASIARRFGIRHHQTFMLLEEARCEVNNYDNLRPLEQAGLRACVLEIVLRDVDPDDTEWQSAVRFVGLLAGRIEKGIVSKRHPLIESLIDKVRDLLGIYFQHFYDLAVEFSRLPWEKWSDHEEKMHDVVRRWIALEDSIPPEDKGEDEADQDGEGDEGEGEGEGQGQPGESQEGEGQGQAARVRTRVRVRPHQTARASSHPSPRPSPVSPSPVSPVSLATARTRARARARATTVAVPRVATAVRSRSRSSRAVTAWATTTTPTTPPSRTCPTSSATWVKQPSRSRRRSCPPRSALLCESSTPRPRPLTASAATATRTPRSCGPSAEPAFTPMNTTQIGDTP